VKEVYELVYYEGVVRRGPFAGAVGIE